MFRRGQDGVYRSSLLEAEPTIQHGFGTRVSEGWPGDYFRVRQIHSTEIVEAYGNPSPPQGDALFTRETGLWIGIRTADCVPILLADPVQRCVAAVHAGWRGTAGRISGLTVKQLISDSGSRPEDLLAAIGPCIGSCCYEVGQEVADQFAGQFPEAVSLRLLDLAEANRRQLLAAGVRHEHIDVSGLCTRCSAKLEFHSFRRDRDAAGRMVSAIRIGTD